MIKLLIFFSWIGFASSASLKESFPQGKGSSFKLYTKAGSDPASLSIYIASSSSDKINIEYFIESKNSLVPIQMWQQFELTIVSGKSSTVTQGYVQTKEMKVPEKMTPEYLTGFSGIKINDFLFATEDELNKNKIQEEKIQIAAGETKTTHYRTSQNGQTIDYWISDEAKPIGLVKLESKSSTNKDQNYRVELINLMNNVKPFINPEDSVPLSELGKSFLAKPESIK